MVSFSILSVIPDKAMPRTDSGSALNPQAKLASEIHLYHPHTPR
jgi:hypothetical protein